MARPKLPMASDAVATTTNAPDSLRSPFLRIPREIRMLIYDKLVSDRVFWVNFPHDGSIHHKILGSLAILRVSKQIRVEAQRVLRVRTLRVNKCNMEEFKLFPRILKVISRWTLTIESVLVGYSSYEFGSLIEWKDHRQQERVFAGLREIICHLPNLTNLILTCDGLVGRQSTQLDVQEQLSRFSKDLSTSLPLFNRIRILTADKQTHYFTHELEVEIKLFKTTPVVKGQSSNTAQVPNLNRTPAPNERKVLLDVIKDSESDRVHWLTVEPSQ